MSIGPVSVTTAPGSDKTKITVNVDVVERPTGLFSIGGGFSSVDAFLGTIDISQRNFLGRGWEVSARIRAGSTTQQGIISFTDPWFLDRPLAAGFDIFDTVREFDEFKLDSLGLTLRVSAPFADYWRWLVQYRLTRARFVEEAELKDGIVGLGTEVVLESDADMCTYWILGEGEHHLGEQVISFQTPVARALMGHAIGDEVELETDGKARRYRIVSVERKLPPHADEPSAAPVS